MAAFAPAKRTRELGNVQGTVGSDERVNKNKSNCAQALSDQLALAGIPWRMAKRVASVVGGPTDLRALYDSCCNETAKVELLSHIIACGEDHDQGNLRSSSNGWSNAIFCSVAASAKTSSSDETKLSGQSALLLHKDLVEDHGLYLSTLHQGHSPEETLEKVLDNPASTSPTLEENAPRHVNVSLTKAQAKKYFSFSGRDDKTFYKLSILSDEQSISQAGAITMQTVSRSFASKPISIFELEGADIVDLVRDSWGTERGNNFVLLTKTVARLIDNLCHKQDRCRSSGNKRILMVCGLQPALDANAKKAGYATETRTVVDLVFAELLLCYDVTILQALRKNSDDRVNLVKQLALACLHCGLLTENLTN
jgi:hypothetical protein